ncbi:MAG: NAD(P)H-hydrate dehydratase [Hyphomonadaceae bacterium]
MNEIITIAQMRAIDEGAAAAGVPTSTLMENAGRAVADAACARFQQRPVIVACGPGNNGGDGWVAARLLRVRGWDVRVLSLVPREALRGDAAAMAQAWDGPVGAPSDDLNDALVIDALFGAGLARPLEGDAARLAQIMSQSPERVVAVDVPSGLHGDTGAPLGEACVRAALTVTFVRKKAAHVLMPGRHLCGAVIVADIGAPEDVVAAQGVTLYENGPGLWGASFPWPDAETHKHARGHVMVASGGRMRTGAARLAARGALRAGAGLVTVLSPLRAIAENAAQLTAIMLDAATSPGHYSEAALKADAMVIGPAFGLEERHRERLHAARSTQKRRPIVFDADAITLLAPIKRGQLQPRDVITPHVGEFKRAFPNLLSNSNHRIEAARAAAAACGATVLLKGPDTVIAAADGRAAVNTTGAPSLATAGSGDVLAGFVAALIAQGMPSFEAAAAAAWLHGRTAEAYGRGLIAEDIPEIFPAVLNALAKNAGKAGADS